MRGRRNPESLCPTVTDVIGRAGAIDYISAPQGRSRGHMQKDSKDKLKILPDHGETQSLDDQVLVDVAGSDDTQRVRTLTVQQLEQLLKKDKKTVP